jgi:hypothetical protein
MSADIEQLPPPEDPTAFESLCLELWKDIWNDPSAQKNGRSGQPQAGVDIFSQAEGLNAGIQCKQKDGLVGSTLTSRELADEVIAARKFSPPLKSFVLATTAPRDAKLQEQARLLSEKNQKEGLFTVEIWSWKDIWAEIYKREALRKRLLLTYWPALAGSGNKSKGISTGIVVLIILVVCVPLVAWFLNKEWKRMDQPVLSLPRIVLESLSGLPEGMTNDPNLRLHRLFVQNTDEVGIENFVSRLQLPEPVLTTIETNKAAGAAIGWRPLLDKLTVLGTGGRSEGGLWISPTSSVHFVAPQEAFVYSGPLRSQLGTISKPGDITGIWELTIDKLPANGFVEMLFVTSIAPQGKNYAVFANMPFPQNISDGHQTPDTNELRFYLEGQCQHPRDTRLYRQQFFVPFDFNPVNRKVSSKEVRRDIGKWNPVALTFQ